MDAWLIPLVTVIGSVGGAYAGVRVSVAKLEQRIEAMVDRIERLEEEMDKRVRDRLHAHNESILKLDGRVTRLETRRRT